MRNLIAILSVFMLLESCNSLRKSISSSKQEHETTARNDISSFDKKHFLQVTDQFQESFMNERLSIDIAQTKYDTDKRFVEETKKYPIIEETKITIRKNTDTTETDSIHQGINSISVIESIDFSDINTKIKVETKEEKKSTLNKYLILSLIICGAFFIFIICKTIRWKVHI